MTQRIPLHGRVGKGKFALVDDEDAQFLLQYRWVAMRAKRGNLYAQSCVYEDAANKVFYLMHRLILGLERGDGHVTDHINHNGLDNRRANLRVVTVTENNRNTRAKGPSGYAGVSRINTKPGGFVAKIGSTSLGHYDTARDAALARDAAARELYGDGCYLNFPNEHGAPPRRRARPKGINLKLSAQQANEIRHLHAAGGTNFQQLGRRFGVSGHTIADIVKRRRYQDVD